MTIAEKKLLGVGAATFFAGVGATVVGAFALDELEKRREAVVHRANLAEERVELFRCEAREGRSHVQALLRQPHVSKSDHDTDRKAASAWLAQRDPGQSTVGP